MGYLCGNNGFRKSCFFGPGNTVLTVFSVFISALRWYLLLKAFSAKVEFLRVVRILFIGLFFNTFVPGGFAGDIVRGVQSKGDTLSIEEALSSVLTDRILGLLGLVFLSIIGALYQWELIKQSGLSLYLLLICLFLIGVIGMLYSQRTMRIFRFILPLTGKFGPKIKSLYRNFYQYRYKMNTIYSSLGITLINHLVMFISVYYLAISLVSKVAFSYFVVFLPLIGTLSMLPITIGGLGVRELGFVMFFPLVGMTKGQALGTSLFFFSGNGFRCGRGRILVFS